jgi:hypothetical protein
MVPMRRRAIERSARGPTQQRGTLPRRERAVDGNRVRQRLQRLAVGDSARRVALVAAALGTLSACDQPSAPPRAGPGVPPDVRVEVLNPDRPPALRCNPEIRLSSKITAGALEAVARNLLQGEAEGCDFGVAAFYLPAMRPESGAWAIAELGPEVAVSILGLSAEDEQILERRAAAKGEVLGVWIDDTSYASVLSLYRDGGGLKLARWYPDGGQAVEPIRVSRQGGAYELRDAGAAGRGRHYRVVVDGDLESWDGKAFLSAARKVRLDVDLGTLVGEEASRQARRARVASAGRNLARAAAAEERWRKFSQWLTLYDGLDALRPEVNALGDLTDPEERSAACTRFVRSFRAVPPGVADVPARIDVAPLLAGLERLQEACAQDREIQILLESSAAIGVWQQIDREVAKVVADLRPKEDP